MYCQFGILFANYRILVALASEVQKNTYMNLMSLNIVYCFLIAVPWVGSYRNYCQGMKYKELTLSPETIHRDSVSRHRDSFKHLSNNLLISTPKSDNLPGSKLGQAMGDNSTLMNNVPSEGRACLGSTT